MNQSKSIDQIRVFAEPTTTEKGTKSYKNIVPRMQGCELGEIPPEHVRIKMRYVCVCGTDVHLLSMDERTVLIKTSAPCYIPETGRLIGHEGAGEVIGLGSSVHHLVKGDLVSLESLLSCGFCDVCRRGKPNQCRSASLMGLQFDGLFAEVVDVPAKLARAINDYISTDVDVKAGACLEPAGVAFLACENVRLSASDRVVIFGAGPIGAYCAMLAKCFFGVTHVVTVEILPHRRKLAEGWSSKVFSPEEFLGERFKFDVLFECSGNMESLSRAFHRIDPNGRVCVLARSGQDLYLNAMDHMITNNIAIIGSRGHLGGIYERMLPLIKSGQFPILDVVTRELNGLHELLDYLRDPKRIIQEECKVACRIS